MSTSGASSCPTLDQVSNTTLNSQFPDAETATKLPRTYSIATERISPSVDHRAAIVTPFENPIPVQINRPANPIAREEHQGLIFLQDSNVIPESSITPAPFHQVGTMESGPTLQQCSIENGSTAKEDHSARPLKALIAEYYIKYPKNREDAKLETALRRISHDIGDSFQKNYILNEEIGHGSFGTVNVVTRIKDGKQVILFNQFAAKFFRKETWTYLRWVDVGGRRVPSEVAALLLLKKETIIEATDYCDDGNSICLVTEIFGHQWGQGGKDLFEFVGNGN